MRLRAICLTKFPRKRFTCAAELKSLTAPFSGDGFADGKCPNRR